MREAVIVSYARTGLAKSGRGGFNITPTISMAAHAVKHAVERSGVESEAVEDCFVGNVAGVGTRAGINRRWPTRPRRSPQRRPKGWFRRRPETGIPGIHCSRAAPPRVPRAIPSPRPGPG